MAFIGNIPTNVPLTGSQIANGTIVNANVATNTLNLTQKVTSTLPFANGGTGLSALGTAGQALVVNSGATALEYSTVGAQAGQVIQVVSARDSTQRSTSSGSFVTASNTLSVTITPSSTSNKIYLICTTQFYAPTGYFTIYRNGSTNLGDATYGLGMATDGDLGVRAPGAISYYDSPATTSATTYQVYIKGNPGAGQSGFVNYNNVPGTIMAFEVKG